MSGPSPYEQLLEATIHHLQRLKQSGVHHVAVSPQAMALLRAKIAPASPVRPTAKPAAPSVPVKTLPPSQTAQSRSSVDAPDRPVPAAKVVLQAVPPVVPRPVLEAPEKAAAFSALQARVASCQICEHLAAARKNVVFGVGNINAELMFVGEAPGADEDLQGEPFVGKAGELLTRIIQTMGLVRDTVYIANILKCRPDTPGQSSGNRKPTPEEMQTCIPFLQEQIDLIRPKVLVALGATAVEGLLGKTVGITRLRGKWQTYRGIPLMPTYHPAYLLRNQAMSEKRRVWEDMLMVMERLGIAISAKQRGYFLRG